MVQREEEQTGNSVLSVFAGTKGLCSVFDILRGGVTVPIGVLLS